MSSDKHGNSNAHKTYKLVLNLLRKKYNHNEKWSNEIDSIMKTLIGSKAKKTIGWNEYNSTKSNKGNYTVINTAASNQEGVHWVGIYQRGSNIFMYDSFGRHSNNILHQFVEKMKQQGNEVIDVTHIGDQGQYQNDCGLRAIAWLFLVKMGGLNYALSIHKR